MSTQSEYDQAYTKRLAAIEANTDYTVLSSMNQPQTGEKVTQYIVYTDYRPDQTLRTSFSIFVYTPFENVDKYGHSKAEYQAQLLFEIDRWQAKMHITVLETLGSETRLAFYDFQNMGLAQLGLKAFVNLAKKAAMHLIEGNISSFDKEDSGKLQHLFEKFGFSFTADENIKGIARVRMTL